MKSSTTAILLLMIFFLFQADLLFASKSEKESWPNILIIMADDCTFSDLPLYGGENLKTPNIDKLAEEGLVFNNAFVTMSMCVPCRAELYTGLYPVRNGVAWNHSRARDGITSIVQYFDNYGYRTGIAGKVHASPKSVFPFEKVEGVERNCVSVTAEYDSKGLADFVNRSDKDPFCLIAALVVPHIPWTVGDASQFDLNTIKLPPYLAETLETKENFAKYLAEVDVLDQQVGMTLDMLEKSGKADNTIVIFTSEQVAQWPFCKWTVWDQGVHSGFIVRWPGKVAPGTRTDAIIQYVDVLPTLYEAITSNELEGIDGKSFLKVLKGENETHRNYAYFMHNNVPEGPPYPIRSLTDGKFHYIHNLNHEALYNEKHVTGRVSSNKYWMSLNNYWPSWMFHSARDEKNA